MKPYTFGESSQAMPPSLSCSLVGLPYYLSIVKISSLVHFIMIYPFAFTHLLLYTFTYSYMCNSYIRNTFIPLYSNTKFSYTFIYTYMLLFIFSQHSQHQVSIYFHIYLTCSLYASQVAYSHLQLLFMLSS